VPAVVKSGSFPWLARPLEEPSLSNADQNEYEGLFRFFETSADPCPYLACEKSKSQVTTLLAVLGFFAPGMKTLRLSSVLAWLLIFMRPINAQEPVNFEKIRDVSPDGKFAVRILCSREPEDPDNIDRSLVTAVELVSLPSKKTVATLLQNDEFHTSGFEHSTWSHDSNWFAASFSSGVHETDTSVCHRSGENFADLNTDDLRVDAKGDVRNEYVRPIRWLKPGVLLLEQHTFFYGEGGDVSYRFIAKFDDKTSKFEITSKKKIPRKE
jgi:hypothetical protein